MHPSALRPAAAPSSSTWSSHWPKAPRPSGRGRTLYRFTRHPRAELAIKDLEARASDKALLAMMLRFTDREGCCFAQTREFARHCVRSGPLSPRRGHHAPPEAPAACDPDSEAMPQDKPRPRRRLGVTYDKITLDVSARNLRDAGLLDWDYVPPNGRFPNGRQTDTGGRIFFVNLAALNDPERTELRWSRRNPRLRSKPPASTTPPAPSPDDGADDAMHSGENSHDPSPAPELTVVDPAAAPPLPSGDPLREPSSDALAPSGGGATSTSTLIAGDQGAVIEHDHSSDPLVVPTEQNLDLALRAGPQRPPAAQDAGATRPLESPREALDNTSAPLHANLPPRGLTAAHVPTEPATGSEASPPSQRGADAPKSALRGKEHGPGQVQPERPRVRSGGGPHVQPNGQLFVTDPDGVQHSITDLLREMPPWFRTLAEQHRRRRATPPPAARHPSAPIRQDHPYVVAGPWNPRDPTHGGRS